MEWKANSTGPSSDTHRLTRRAPLVDRVTLVDGEIDHDQALEGVGVAQVHERPVGQALVGPAEVEDAGRPAAGPATNSLRLTCMESSTLPMGTRRRNSSEWASASATPWRDSSPSVELLDVLGAARRRRARGRG